MTVLLGILALIAGMAIALTVNAVRKDGYRKQPTKYLQ